MSFSALPSEIVLLIAKELDDEKDISSLMRTGARNYKLLLSFLYENNVKFHSGSALIWCVDHGNETGVRLLLDFCADAKESASLYHSDSELLSKTPVGPLHFAKSETMIQLLLDDGADVDDSPDEWGTPLHAAADRGDIVVAKFLLKNGADIDSSNAYAVAPLHIAAVMGDLDMATFLLDHGACVNLYVQSPQYQYPMISYYGTPLHFALRCEDDDTSFQMTKLLLERGADIQDTNGDLATPLHTAAAECSRAIVELLLNHGALVNIEDSRGITPLYRTVDHPDSVMAKLLLDHGALVTVQQSSRVNTQHGEKKMRSPSPLHHAVAFGVLATVELLISHGAQVNEQDEHGQSCLHILLTHPDPDMIKLLLDHGASVDIQDNSGCAALRDLVRKGRLTKEALLLLKQGALIKVQDEDEVLTADKYELQWIREDLDYAKLLLDYGSDFNIQDSKGKSALDYAAENKKGVVLSLLVSQDPGHDDQPK